MPSEEVVKLLQTSERIRPPDVYRSKSYLSDPVTYQEKYAASIRDPASFWDEIADDLIWQRRDKTVIAGEMPDFQFYPGSLINVSENCVDRHAVHPDTKDKIALYFESENGERKSITYQQLHAEVQKFANVLTGLGLAKGGDLCECQLPSGQSAGSESNGRSSTAV